MLFPPIDHETGRPMTKAAIRRQLKLVREDLRSIEAVLARKGPIDLEDLATFSMQAQGELAKIVPFEQSWER